MERAETPEVENLDSLSEPEQPTDTHAIRLDVSLETAEIASEQTPMAEPALTPAEMGQRVDQLLAEFWQREGIEDLRVAG